MGITDALYALARLLNDISALLSGNVGRRAKNKAAGRAIGRSRIWK